MKRIRIVIGSVVLALLSFFLPLSSVEAQTEERGGEAAAAFQTAFQLTPAVPSVSRPFVVDATTALSVSLTAPSQTLLVTLVAPNGAQFLIGSAPTAGFESGIFLIDSQTTTPGATYLGTITNPTPGTWTMQVAETLGPSGTLDVVALVLLNNSVRLLVAGGGDSFPLGVNIRLALVLFDGTAKTRNLAVQSRIFVLGDPTFVPQTLVFRDDGLGADEVGGDGIYEAFANPGRAGTFQVQTNVSGTASTGAVARTAATTLRVVTPKASIQSFTDRGIDSDADGLINSIGVTPTATILEDGNYIVTVRLRGSNGKDIQRSLNATLSQGLASPEVVFDVADISRDVGVNGPYRVAEVRFLERSGGDFVPADIRFDMGLTSAYSLTDFQRLRLSLTGTGADAEFDTNGNNLFDRIEISVEVKADFAGVYNFSASLRDIGGRELGFFANSQSLTSGLTTLTFAFPGAPIGQSRLNGPYFLSNLVIYGAGQSLIASRAFTTRPLLASQFEGGSLPSPFGKIAPANGATGQSASPTLSWGAASAATGYDYCYDTTNDAACSVWTSAGANTNVGLSGLTVGVRYYWQVRANNSGGTTYADGGSTVFWSFVTGPQADSFEPDDAAAQASVFTPGTSQSHTFHVGGDVDWARFSGVSGVQYTMYTSGLAASVDTVMYLYAADAVTVLASDDDGNGGFASRIVYTATTTGNYYVKVIQFSATGALGAYTLTLDPVSAPGAFGKSLPVNGATGASTSPTLSWGGAPGATGYEYCIDPTNDNSCSGWTSAGTNTSVGLNGLSVGTPYFWHVRATNAGGTTYADGSVTAFWSFSTQGSAPAAFGKVMPYPDAPGQSPSPLLLWDAAAGATGYEYCIDTTNDNACIGWTSTGTNTSVVLLGLGNSTTYYWQVRATSGGATTYADGSSTAFRSFTTIAPAPRPVGTVGPTPGSVGTPAARPVGAGRPRAR